MIIELIGKTSDIIRDSSALSYCRKLSGKSNSPSALLNFVRATSRRLAGRCKSLSKPLGRGCYAVLTPSLTIAGLAGFRAGQRVG